MTDREDELAHLRGLQAKHRKNIRMLEEMLANYRLERPLPLLNNLDLAGAAPPSGRTAGGGAGGVSDYWAIE